MYVLSLPQVDLKLSSENAVTPKENAVPTAIQTVSVMHALVQKRSLPAALYISSLSPSPAAKPTKPRPRRVVNRDPDRPAPKAWSAQEVAAFQQLIARDGPGAWEAKATILGSGRSAKALHTRWLREQGRIVDRSRSTLSTGEAGTPPTPVLAGFQGVHHKAIVSPRPITKRIALEPGGPTAKPVKRRRVVKRDPDKPSPKAWSEKEVKEFQDLIERDGPGAWEAKSVALGGVRSAKALHTRWLREQGRIIDRPRGFAAAQQHALDALMMLATELR